MKVRNLLLAAGALAVVSAAPAAAQEIEAQKGYKCNSKSLAADWLIILHNGSKNGYCDVSIDKNGKIQQSECFEKKTNKGVGALSGTLEITKRCAISGTLTFKPASGKSSKVDAEWYMDAAGTSFAGILGTDEGDFDTVQAIRMK
jgi:hypothetical protein